MSSIKLDRTTAVGILRGESPEWDILPIFVKNHDDNMVEAVFRRKADGRHFKFQWYPHLKMEGNFFYFDEVAMRVETVESWMSIDRYPPIPAPGWYGFDLDGTLAKVTTPFDIMTIGEPILPMVEKLKKHLDNGDVVKIFTARVAITGGWSPFSCHYASTEFARKQEDIIQSWCREHIGTILPVTAIKDFACLGLYDDRAIQVIPGTGELVEEQLSQTVNVFGKLRASINPRE